MKLQTTLDHIPPAIQQGHAPSKLGYSPYSYFVEAYPHNPSHIALLMLSKRCPDVVKHYTYFTPDAFYIADDYLWLAQLLTTVGALHRFYPNVDYVAGVNLELLKYTLCSFKDSDIDWWHLEEAARCWSLP